MFVGGFFCLLLFKGVLVCLWVFLVNFGCFGVNLRVSIVFGCFSVFFCCCWVLLGVLVFLDVLVKSGHLKKGQVRSGQVSSIWLDQPN